MKYSFQLKKLLDLADVKGGKRLPKDSNLIEVPNSHPYIRVRDLTGKRKLELDSSYLYVDDETQKRIAKYIVNTGDIVISVVGTIGLVSIVGSTLNNANLTENCDKIINLKQDVDKGYLYYYLKSDFGKAEIKKGTVGAVQPKLPIKNIENFDILFPDIYIQKRIARLLSIIDDKIELNNKINDNLQQQSLALFNNFYDSIHGNEVCFQDNHVFGKLIMGQSPKGESYNTDMIGVPLINGAADYTNMILTPQKFTSAPTRVCKKNDLVFCIRATIGLLVFADKEYCLGRGVASISATSDEFVEFIYHIINRSIEHLKNQANGSVIVGINKDDILKLKIKMPSHSEIKEFHKLQKPLFNTIENLRLENIYLKELRDTLLPKLMLGEIDVSSIKLDL